MRALTKGGVEGICGMVSRHLRSLARVNCRPGCAEQETLNPSPGGEGAASDKRIVVAVVVIREVGIIIVLIIRVLETVVLIEEATIATVEGVEVVGGVEIAHRAVIHRRCRGLVDNVHNLLRLRVTEHAGQHIGQYHPACHAGSGLQRPRVKVLPVVAGCKPVAAVAEHSPAVSDCSTPHYFAVVPDTARAGLACCGYRRRTARPENRRCLAGWRYFAAVGLSWLSRSFTR
ncbi:Uncharacterised protein [Providencia rustigianii]|nr:Uncharacterised protein [Providencia rustigianii]